MLRRRRWFALGVPLAVLGAAGAVFVWGELQPRPVGYAPTDPGTKVAAAATAVAVPEATQITVDARDQSVWTFFDFDRASLVQSTFDGLDWDLAFRRTRLLTNSGATNPAGQAGALDMGEVPLESAVIPQSPTFVIDAFAGDEGDEPRNGAISRWYNYDFIRHVIIARPNVYLVRTSEGQAVLVHFVSYYCDDESPGCVTFRYRLIPAADALPRRSMLPPLPPLEAIAIVPPTAAERVTGRAPARDRDQPRARLATRI